MASVAEILRCKPGFVSLNPASQELIDESERMLRLRFSDDYREYVSYFGAASFEGHELTGICNLSRLDVVNVTLEERVNNPGISHEWYVVEQTHADGIVIWQAQSGEIYKSLPQRSSVLIANSLVEYINYSL